MVNLESGETKDNVLQNTSGELLFSIDGSKLMYAELEAERWKANKIKVHRLGDSQEQDRVIYQEQDDEFFLGFVSYSFLTFRSLTLIAR